MKIIGVRRRSIHPTVDRTLFPSSRPVPGNIAKKFGGDKLTGFLNNKPDQI
jgi:hypothetical protein